MFQPQGTFPQKAVRELATGEIHGNKTKEQIKEERVQCEAKGHTSLILGGVQDDLCGRKHSPSVTMAGQSL